MGGRAAPSGICPSQSFCHWLRPKRGLSFVAETKKSAQVIASNTGRSEHSRSASAYGGSSVHSKMIARIAGCAARMPLTRSTMPGVTRGTSIFSPLITASKASKPGTSSQPWMMNLASSISNPQWLSKMSLWMSRVWLLAVRIRILSCSSSATDTMGHCTMEDMKTGTVATLAAIVWKAIMKPQSPVIPQTRWDSSHLMAAAKSSCTSWVMWPLWAISRVKPGTVRKMIS
mmetsp:Transcript_119952/g.334631  ORF Transcript_119952/g.334631 Transcript_119952/m.334631 type:complete len:230 (-) Transcript_119952:1559-2248(-)